MDQIKIKPSEEFIDVLNKLKGFEDTPKNISNLNESTTLNRSDIEWCRLKIKEKDLFVHIYQLIESSEILLPENEPLPPRNPELELRIQNLRNKQDEREYQSMVQNLNSNNFSNLSGIPEVRKAFNDLNKQLITGAQYLLSIVGTFFGIFFATGYGRFEFGFRVLFAILSAAVVAIAEIYFIIKDDIREEEELERIQNHHKQKISTNAASQQSEANIKIKQN